MHTVILFIQVKELKNIINILAIFIGVALLKSRVVSFLLLGI